MQMLEREILSVKFAGFEISDAFFVRYGIGYTGNYMFYLLLECLFQRFKVETD